MQRPRLCLSSETLEGCLEGLSFTGADHWTVVEALARYAKQEQWVSPGGRSHLADCDESDQKKGSAPPRPAGLKRCDHASQERWTAAEFKFLLIITKAGFFFGVKLPGDRWTPLTRRKFVTALLKSKGLRGNIWMRGNLC